MKARFLSAGFAVVLTFTMVGAARGACGVGTKIWEGNDGTLAKIAAFTTNFFTFYGISTTFEIAGCGPSDNIFRRAASEKVHDYASNNLDHLASDMARGQGEHLDALATLLQLDEGDRAEFGAFSQANLEHLLPRDDVTADEFLIELGHRMAENTTLARYVER